MGVVVVNMDMGWAFERAQSFRSAAESVYVANESGDLLFHPEPGRAFGRDLGKPFRSRMPFRLRRRHREGPTQGGGFLDLPEAGREVAAFLTTRAWDPNAPHRRLSYIVTGPMEHVLRDKGSLRQESLVGMGALLALAIVLIVLMVSRITRSLMALVSASRAIAGGDYRIGLPAADGGEVGELVRAFRSMAGEVETREQALAELTRDLERRVEDRTRELARQHALQQLILENIADGVVVADREGRFLLWNRKAEQIVGSGPDEVSADQWSPHFGVFRDERGETAAHRGAAAGPRHPRRALPTTSSFICATPIASRGDGRRSRRGLCSTPTARSPAVWRCWSM